MKVEAGANILSYGRARAISFTSCGCRRLRQSLSRPYQGFLDALPDTRSNGGPGIVASIAIHLIALAIIALWSFTHQPGFANDPQSVLVELVAQPSNSAKRARAPSTAFPMATIEPDEHRIEQPKFSPSLPRVDASMSPQARADSNDAASLTRAPLGARPRNDVPADSPEKSQSHSGVPSKKGNAKDLADSLRDQIMACWNGASPSAEPVSVDFDLYFNPDGSISQPPQLTAAYAQLAIGDPEVQAEADALRRAIYTCAPYRLPNGRYDDWRAIKSFHFDLKAR